MQTCLLLRFGCKVYALEALFMLELSDFTLFGGTVSNFGLCTIDLCDKSYRLSAADWYIWKTCFGWLPHMQDPINIKLTRILREREYIFCGNRIQRQYDKHGRKVLFVQIFSNVQLAESWNGQLQRRNRSLKEENMPSSFQVLCSLPVAPIFETKGRSTLTVPRVKLIVQGHGGRHDTARLRRMSYCNRAMKHAHTHTHTHTHTYTQRADNCYDFAYTHTQRGLLTTTISLNATANTVLHSHQ